MTYPFMPQKDIFDTFDDVIEEIGDNRVLN